MKIRANASVSVWVLPEADPETRMLLCAVCLRGDPGNQPPWAWTRGREGRKAKKAVVSGGAGRAAGAGGTLGSRVQPSPRVDHPRGEGAGL